jgi:hypothetical protein
MGKKSRSAITGRYVPPAYAVKHPTTTVTETTGKKPTKK